ncbi:Pol polyprotein [Plakobranchus ocellatus]|uniref:Pol polyprotein n=1 Tax=Plakobranchus ocellatus TaxID=259542 RepID=A0AAV4DLH4_9GAST|nr:Pol polyprotein [Plakobranchus ocellatus]
MAEEDIYTIDADIPEVGTPDASLSSYRAYTGPQDGENGVPLTDLPSYRSTYTPDDLYSSTPGPGSSTTMNSQSSFVRFRPSSNRIIAIVAAFLCFCPVGVAALIYSLRAQFAKKEGKFAKAAYLGKSARDLAVASIVLGTCLLLIGLLIVIIIFIPGVKQE